MTPRWTFLNTATATATTTAAIAAILIAIAATGAGATAAAAADDGPPAVVEDYSYPGAPAVLKERGIKLLRGDGHILIVSCGADPNRPPNDLILVQSVKPDLPAGPNFCFKATGTAGYLTMEIPDVYFIRGDDSRTIAAKVEIKDDTPVVEREKVEPSEWQPVGVGQARGAATVLELRFPYAN